jgi:3-(3-hydroxy-phenyl)propionate hydroxylase
MAKDVTLDCDVLIVGAGPTGLVLGLSLARRGVHVIVAERELDRYPLPRAAHIDHQTVRIFQDLGLAQRILASCRQPARYDFLSARGELLLRFEGLDREGSAGWPTANAIHQPSIERALRDALHDAPGLELRAGWRFTHMAQHAEWVEANFETHGGFAALRARYLVGADGAKSRVREVLGVDMDDLSFDESWLIVDAIVRDPSRLPNINLQICDPARPTTCVVMGEGRHRWEFMLKHGETADALLDDAMINALLAPWNVAGAIELERKVVYRFGARVARRWRIGRTLLAGDAAHQTPPFAGQGMCSGLRDAANLSWKLAAILQDGAHDALLDSYQPEREPHARATIQLALLMGGAVCVTDPELAAQRDQQLLAARAAGQSVGAGAPPYPDIASGCILAGSPGAGSYFPQPVVERRRLDDVLGPGAWLITRERPLGDALAGVRAFALDAPELADFRSPLSTWLDVHTATTVLVRADRYVFGSGKASRLMAAYREQLGFPGALPASLGDKPITSGTTT